MSEERSGCFRRGCLGCLALGVVAALIVAVLVAIGVSQATRDPEILTIDETQELRERPDRDTLLPAADPTDPADPEAERPRITKPIRVDEPGRVVLDVGMIEFRVEAAPAGTPIRVEGAYDATSLRVEQTYETEGELGWEYTLRVKRRGILPRIVFNDDGPQRLTLHLPRDVPISLTGLIGAGASRLELGGLWLLEVDLDLGPGEHGLDFHEPLVAPLERFMIDGSYGELGVEGLGNASPLTTRIEHSAGEVGVDLSGDWRADGTVEVRCGFGECGVELPRSARVELDVPRLMFGESTVRTPRRRDDDASLPLVEVAVSASAGEVRVD